LERGDGAEVDCSEPCDGHSTDAIEEGVNVRDVVTSIRAIEDPRADERGKCTGWVGENQLPFPLSRFSRWHPQNEEMEPIKVELCDETIPPPS